MTNGLPAAIERLKATWMSLQVEPWGAIPSSASIGLTTTPVDILKEVPPLKPIEAGVLGNWVFFTRAWLVAAIVGGSFPLMVNQDIPRLVVTAPQVVLVALLAAAVAMATIGVACAYSFFPLPFGVLIVGVPLMCVEAICHIRLVDHQLRLDEALWVEVKRVLASTHCMLSLPFIYPLYIYGFVSFSGTGQVLFVAVLPIMKLIAKNWMNLTLSGRDDIKPEMIVFVVEFFNSLYISNALQCTSTWTSTATVMACDLAGFLLSMVDIVEAFSEIRKLMEKIPRHHPLANENFVQVLLRILAANENLYNNQRATKSLSDSLTSVKKPKREMKYNPKGDPAVWPEVKTARTTCVPIEIPTRTLFQGSQVLPTSVPQHGNAQLAQRSNTATSLTTMAITDIFSREERKMFVRKSMHVLFITEYVIAFEYIEVVSPIVYCTKNLAVGYSPDTETNDYCYAVEQDSDKAHCDTSLRYANATSPSCFRAEQGGRINRADQIVIEDVDKMMKLIIFYVTNKEGYVYPHWFASVHVPFLAVPWTQKEARNAAPAILDEKCTDVVVFLHGFSSMREAWLRVARRVDKRFTIIIPDLPGHGRTSPSDALTDYSMPAQAERLNKFLETEVPADKKIHLVGCSMGGMLAGVYAGLFPDRIKSLTMVCPAGITMPTKSDLLKMLEDSGRNLLLAHTPEDIQEMNRALHFKPVPVPHALASIIATERKKQLPVLEKIISDSLQNPIALEELLPKIRAKTLVLWGKHDRVLDVSSTDILREKLSPDAQGQILLIDRCGHLVQHEKYAECSTAINKHLAENLAADPTTHGQGATDGKSGNKLKQLATLAHQIIPSYSKLRAPHCPKSTYAAP
ncbi:hypothetical protein ON010_g9808 [Phytophthora cinnamomi]|nr:hypothetical protein ON010_g9808 [Phytophthora cinnamomi]